MPVACAPYCLFLVLLCSFCWVYAYDYSGYKTHCCFAPLPIFLFKRVVVVVVVVGRERSVLEIPCTKPF